jgi:hypothetical protein
VLQSKCSNLGKKEKLILSFNFFTSHSITNLTENTELPLFSTKGTFKKSKFTPKFIQLFSLLFIAIGVCTKGEVAFRLNAFLLKFGISPRNSTVSRPTNNKSTIQLFVSHQPSA